MVHLYGKTVWFLSDFMQTYFPPCQSKVSPAPSGISASRDQFAKTLNEQFPEHLNALSMKVRVWMTQMNSELVFGRSRPLSQVISNWSNVVTDGLLLLENLRSILVTIVFFYSTTETPFKMSDLKNISLCAELISGIRSCFVSQEKAIQYSRKFLIHQELRALSQILAPIEKEIAKTLKDKRRDSAEFLTSQQLLFAIDLCLRQLNLPVAETRINILSVALDLSLSDKFCPKETQEELGTILTRLKNLYALESIVETRGKCEFFYFCSDLIPVFFRLFLKSPKEAERLHLLLETLTHPTNLCKSVVHLQNPESIYPIFEEYKKLVFDHLTNEIIRPVAEMIETELRLHSHSLALNQESLKEQTDPSSDVTAFLLLPPLKLWDQIVDLKSSVGGYLDHIFYNLTTIALHDWRIYAEMQHLAEQKYGLILTNSHLPSHSHYSQGLDVLEIMRNIHIFVQKFNYDMHTQSFLERSSDQKYLNSINITHMSNSIRTHGSGFMNTTVNFTYQFLSKKFHIFSEFLFDDHIRSRLVRDIRYFNEKKVELNSKYPWAKAESFVKDIRVLGVSEKSMTFLDHFRQLVTEVGNALGYVRMLRSGGLNACSNAIKFIPNLEEILHFQRLVSSAELSDNSYCSAQNLDKRISSMVKNFSDGVEYFSMLASVIANGLKTSDHGHLKNFFVIVPALTISFVEKQIVQKERIGKKAGGNGEASFSDDGFAFGVAFILKILDQDVNFDSLHWFESLNDALTEKMSKISEQLKQGHSDEEEGQSLKLTIQKIENLRREFELLFFSFNGAHVFFRDDSRQNSDVFSTNPDVYPESHSASEPPANVSLPPPPPPPPAPTK